MSKIKYELIRNPRPRLTPELLLVISNDMPLFWSNHTPGHHLQADEYVCELSQDPSWPEKLIEWHMAATCWMPHPALDWWLPWFKTEPHLEHMPFGWWCRRAVALAIATTGRSIVGVGALTVVNGGEHNQGAGAFDGDAMCYEVRGVVVAPSCRRTGIFTGVVEHLLAEARRRGQANLSDSLPTFLATRNPMLQIRLRQLEQREGPKSANGRMPREELLNYLVCWCKRHYPPCAECPQLSGVSRWWGTHTPLPPGQSHDKFSWISAIGHSER